MLSMEAFILLMILKIPCLQEHKLKNVYNEQTTLTTKWKKNL